MSNLRHTERMQRTAWHMAARNFVFRLMTLITVAVFLAPPARADQHVGDFCRIKGQEENTLHGMGLVVGLRGTGDGDSKATLRDQVLAEHLSDATADTFAGPMFEMFMLRRD